MKFLAQHLPAYGALAGLLLTVLWAAWVDLRQWRIPNRLLAPSAAAALMLSAFMPGGQGLAASLLGGLVGLMVFMPLYLLKGMAAGDVKLMGVVGLYSGAALTLDIALLTALIGGLWVITLFQWQMHGNPTRDPKRIRQFGICLRHRGLRANTHMNTHANASAKAAAQNKSLLIPYGAVIATGTVLALLIASH
jgi:prepilin peptidase CpaA